MPRPYLRVDAFPHELEHQECEELALGWMPPREELVEFPLLLERQSVPCEMGDERADSFRPMEL